MEIDVRLKAILPIRLCLSSGGGKPIKFSAFVQEIPCETTAAMKVIVKPLIHTTARTILIIFSLINIFASDARENRTYVADVSMASK